MKRNGREYEKKISIAFWFDYFSPGTDYAAVKERLSAKDPYLSAAVKFGSGIRLLKQDFFETRTVIKGREPFFFLTNKIEV